MLSYSMNIILSVDLHIDCQTCQKAQGSMGGTVEDAACPVELGREVGRRGE